MIGAVYFPGALSQAAALACLSPEVVRPRSVSAARSWPRPGRRLTEQLTGLGLTVAPSQANFLWLPLAERAVPFAEAARQAGILVTALPGLGVRITIGSPSRQRAALRRWSPTRHGAGAVPAVRRRGVNRPDRGDPSPCLADRLPDGRARLLQA